MIIQCPKCETKFRVPDAKVAAAGVKVRCSKCAHLFVVRKNSQEAEPAPAPAPAPSPPAASSAPSPALSGPPQAASGAPSPSLPSLDAPAAAPLDAFDSSAEAPPFGAPSGASPFGAASAAVPPPAPPSDDPFDWSGVDLGQSEPVESPVDPFLGPGAPRFSSGVASGGPPAPPGQGPPPLPRPETSAPFSVDLDGADAPDDEGSVRFPPPPALTNDLAPKSESSPPLAMPSSDALSLAIGNDPFELPDDPSMPSSPPSVQTPSPSPSSSPYPPPFPPDEPREPASPSREIPIMRGRTESPRSRGSATIDVPIISKGGGPRPHPPVSSLRWPPWLGVALGLAAALYALPELFGEAKPQPSGGEAELETLALRVSPYAQQLPPRLWVVSGTAETKSRPFPHGVQVEVRLPGAEAPVLAHAIVGQEVPESVLAAGPEAVAQFMRVTPPPSLGPASRQRFVTIVDEEPQDGDIDVRYEALPPPEDGEAPFAVDDSKSPR